MIILSKVIILMTGNVLYVDAVDGFCSTSRVQGYKNLIWKKLAFSRIHTQINKYFFLNFLKVCQNQTNRNNNNRG